MAMKNVEGINEMPRKNGQDKHKLSASDIERFFQQAIAYFYDQDFLKAEPLFHQVLLYSPNHVDALGCLGIIVANNKKFEQAETLFAKAAKLDPSDPSFINNLGISQKNQGKYEEAISSFQIALEIEPDDYGYNINLGNVFTRVHKYDEAISCYKRALKLKPGDRYILLRLGKVYHKNNMSDNAVETFKKIIDIDPSCVDAHTDMAKTLEKANRYDEAYDSINNALELQKDNILAKICLGKIQYRKGNIQDAKKILEAVIQKPVQIESEDDEDILSEPYFLLGSVYNKIKDYNRAFNSFLKGNQIVFQNNENLVNELRAKNSYYVANPRPLKKWFSPAKIERWTNCTISDHARPDPVFMIGFSRSGTTLLDQVLDSHPFIQTLGEKPTMHPIFDAYCSASDEKKFINLSDKDFRSARGNYWKEVEKFLGTSLGNNILVDRNPFGSIHIGHKLRFFPQTKFIVTVRDPRDVCISNFMQNFSVNHATMNFFTIKETAKYYASVMDMLFHYLKVLPLNIHFVHYENLVENFASEVRKVIAFLGLDWNDNVLDFQETARKKNVRTASYHQVIKPLYKSSIGSWKNYEDQLNPVLYILKPYVDFFKEDRETS